MTDHPNPASFVWGDDQPEPDGPALGTYEAPSKYPSPFERRQTVGAKLARFLDDLADCVRGWH